MQPDTASQHVVIYCIVVSVLSLFATGCQNKMADYQPNAQLIAELGRGQAQQRLRDILLRSVNPSIDAVEITTDFVRVDLAGTTYQVRVFFKDIHRVDVFKNHLVVIYGQGDRQLFRPVLANDEDARAFANLMLSFQEYLVTAHLETYHDITIIVT